MADRVTWHRGQTVRGVAALVGAGVLLAAPQAARSQPPAAPGAALPAADARWPVRTREHVDLWLHGLAMLTADTARVPLFRRAYADSMRARRARAGVVTALDTDADRLRARLAANPRLALGAQFVPLAFASWAELTGAVEAFARAGGDPRRAADRSAAAAAAVLASAFPAAADRDLALRLVRALTDERDRFYHAYWITEQRDRTPTLHAAESAWRAARPRLQRYLNYTLQQDGELILSLPLGGEGRTTSNGSRRHLVAVGFPDTPGAAVEAVYAFAHEAVGSAAETAVTDHTTPAEQRAGIGARHTAAAQVRGGFVLLQRTAPDLAEGYARFYLRLAGAEPPSDPATALAAAFPLPHVIVDALRQQIEIALEGI